jgi:hypothetical protein
MFRKINNRYLSIVFIALLIIVIVFIFLDSDRNERTFREVLVDIDSTAASKLVIISQANNFQPLNIYKQTDGWFVELENGKTARVTNQKAEQAFKDLTGIKPKRLTARGEDKWNSFKVDSTGTRVQVFEGDNITLDIVLGRFNYQQQPRSVSTYVRLFNDNDIYEVDGFLAMTFNQKADAFRDGSIVSGDFNTWNNLKFDYPADSSFTLTKLNNKWFINNVETDSLTTVNYLRKLSSFSRTNFADDVEIKPDQNPTYNLTITDANLEFTEVKAFVDTNYVVISSQNQDTKFDGKSFGSSLFVGQSSFFKPLSE